MFTSCGSKTNTILDEIYLLIYIDGNFKHIIFKISDLSNFRGGNSPPMVFNSSSLRSENPISRELKLNLFNELVELVRKMWAILSGRIPEWLILAETNLWEYFEDVRIGDGGAPGGKSWVDGVLSTWKRCWGQRRQVTVGKKEYRWQWIATIKYFCLVWQAFKLSI